MSISEKWINAIFSIATGSRLRRNLMTPVGFIIFLTFIAGLVFLALFLDKVLEFKEFISSPLDLILGSIIFIPGIILTASCVIYFFIKKGTPVPLNPPPELITDGPYTYTRNPMITGLFLLYLGFGIFYNSLSLTFIIAPVYLILNYLEIKKIEEPELVKRFGDDYLEYKKNVPMFIPRFKK